MNTLKGEEKTGLLKIGGIGMTFSANVLNYIVLGVGNMEILPLVRALCLIRIKALNWTYAQLHNCTHISAEAATKHDSQC